jgi:hypothetical protein
VIRYHFDLYPRDDPRDGARVVRFTKLQQAEYRGEANGTGAGRLSIRADVAEAQLIDPRGLQYIRVVREDTVAETEAVVGGFFLETGDFSLLDEQGTRLLSFGGAGVLSYLSRAIMASHTYISPIFTGQDPFDDQWRLYAQSTVYANGNYLGAMLWRVLYEATHNVPGTHRHEEGVDVSHTHADDRPAIAIPDLVFNFDQYEDSNGNDWTLTSGEFKAQVGENVLAVIKRLMEAGLYVSMDPDTFELSAYQAATHRRDRTGGAWGASVIRFQAPTGEDIATGNIKSDAKRAMAAFIKRSWLLAGGNDVYGDATGGSDVPWEGFYYADVNDATAAAGIASVQVGARDDAGDTLRLRGRLGTDKNNGYYRPFEDALLDDLATVHTGTDQFDHDEQDFPIAAITINLRPGGDWDVWYDLGSSYSANPSRQFQVQPVPAHNHTFPFCQPGNPGTSSSTRLYFSTTAAGFSITADSSWVDGGSLAVHELTTTPDGSISSTGSGTTWTAVNAAADEYIGEMTAHAVQITDATTLAAVQAGGLDLHAQMRWRSRYGIGISEANQNNYFRAVVRVYRTSTTTFIGTAVADAIGGTKFLAQATHANRSVSDTFAAVPGAALNDWLIFELGTHHVGPTSGGTGSAALLTSDGVADLPEDESSTSGLNAWIEFSQTGVGATEGDLPHDTVHQGAESVGTANRAARCDHEHAHGLLSADGTEYHDFSNITLSDETPLVESGAGDAGTEEQASRSDHVHPEFGGSGVSDHGDLTGLADNDHPQYRLTTDGGQDVISVVAASGSTETLDLADGNVHDVTLTDDCTLTLTGATNGVACDLSILLRQGASPPHLVTWPGSVEWVGGDAPTLQTAENAWDWVYLRTLDGGTTWFGQHAGTSSASSSTSSGHILISSTHSTPLVFDDLLQNSDGDDLLYADT